MKLSSKIGVGHKKYDELLISSIDKINKNISREDFIKFFLDSLFAISTIKYLVVLETHDDTINDIDDLTLFYIKDKKKYKEF